MHDKEPGISFMDMVSDLEWFYRQDFVKIHHGQMPFLGLYAVAVSGLVGIRERINPRNQHAVSLKLALCKRRQIIKEVLH